MLSQYSLFTKVRIINVDGSPWYHAEDFLKALDADYVQRRLSRLSQYVEVTTHTDKGVKYIPLEYAHSLSITIGTTKGVLASKWIDKLIRLREQGKKTPS